MVRKVKLCFKKHLELESQTLKKVYRAYEKLIWSNITGCGLKHFGFESGNELLEMEVAPMEKLRFKS